MNKKFMKVMALSMAVMTSAAVFASCGKDGSGATETNGGTTGGDSTATAFKIGCIGPATGDVLRSTVRRYSTAFRLLLTKYQR